MNQITPVISDEMAEEIRAVFVEGEFNSRWELIRAYHQAGELMKDVPTEALQDLAVKVGRSERTLRYAIKFYKSYPVLDSLPEGKNVSMNKIITKYLTTPKEIAEHTHTPITVCSVCHQRLDTPAK